MATVRPLTLEELPRLSSLGEQFFEEGRLPGKFVASKFEQTWATFYGIDWGVVFGLFEGEEIVGALGATIYPDPNDGELVSTEMFWFVGPEWRGQGLKLLNKFEEWSNIRGAKRVTMVHLVNLAPEALRKLYLKRGYREVEVHFIKSI